jgi:hypothetical protein
MRGAQMRCEPKASAAPAVVIVFCPERAIFHSIRRANCFGTIRFKHDSIGPFSRPEGRISGANWGKRGVQELFPNCYLNFHIFEDQMSN